MMDGKMFMRVFAFANSYGHSWARALHSPSSALSIEEMELQDTAFHDAVKRSSPFDRAVDAWYHAKDDKELDDAEAMLISLVDTEDKQRALLKDSYIIQTTPKEESDYECEFGILACKVFSEEKTGPLEYKYSTDSGRLSVNVHDDVAEFSISRPGEPNLFCLRVKGEAYNISSGEPDAPLDEEACWRRWEKYLRLRHVLAMKDVVHAFFALQEDRELLQRILATVNETAIDIFSTQVGWSPARFGILPNSAREKIRLPVHEILTSSASPMS